MNNMVMLDDVMYNLYCAEKCLDAVVEIDDFSYMFEKNDSEVSQNIDNNEKQKTKASSFIKKAWEALKKMMIKLADAFKDFVAKQKLSPADRAAFEKYKALCASNPELKNKKVTVKDWQLTMKEYQRLIDEIKKVDMELAKGKDVNLENITKKVDDFMKSTGKTIAVSCTLETAMNMCVNNTARSASLYKIIFGTPFMKQMLTESIGETNTKRTEKELRIMSKRVSIRRKLHEMNRHEADTIRESIGHTWNSVQAVFNAKAAGKAKIDGSWLANPEISVAPIRALKKGIGKVVKGTEFIKNVGDYSGKDPNRVYDPTTDKYYSKKKNRLKNMGTAAHLSRNMLGNDDIKKTVNTAVDIRKQGEKEFTKAYRHMRWGKIGYDIDKKTLGKFFKDKSYYTH